MKRFVLLSLLFVCFSTGYGQIGQNKKVTRIPADSASMSIKRKSAQVIDGSQSVQTRASGQSANPYVARGNQRLLKQPVASTGVSNTTVQLRTLSSIEPQSVFIERERTQSQVRSSIAQNHKETTLTFFKEMPQLKIGQPEQQIRIDTMETDHLNMTHVKGTQLHRNIPVYGMNFTFHISAVNERFLGYTLDTMLIQTVDAQITSDEAIRLAERDLSQTTDIKAPSTFMKKHMNYTQPVVETIYYPIPSGVYSLCYKVIIRPNIRDQWHYYLDASTGEIVDKFNNTPFDGPATGTGKDLSNTSRTVNTYLENGLYYMVNTTKSMFKATDFSGNIGVFDAKNDKRIHTDDNFQVGFASSSSSTWNNPAAISTMYHTNIVYDYLKNTHNRTSFDDKGASMSTFINVVDPKTYLGMDNAFWNGSIVVLGNGYAEYSPLANGLDVIAHEWGHAVVEFSAKLEYRFQSGAINETFADIQGAMVDRTNWKIAENVVKNKQQYPSGALRDMSNPHNGGKNKDDDCWQPMHVSEMLLVPEENDHGGVHTNSGITNYAYYLFATATSKEKAEKIFYRALFKYLTPTAKFIDLRKAVIQSAKDLGYSNDVTALGNAFDKVGIIEDTVAPPPPPDIPTNPGGWGLLFCNTDAGDPYSLYKTTDYRTFTGVLQTVMNSTPSVTDDGKFTVFVDGDNNIRILDMTTGGESILNDEGDNFSVAISRDGKRVAVTVEAPIIWVYDINKKKWQDFKLYNPSTGSGGSTTGGPRYADAIEFDHTGENIIYDAYNVVGSSVGGRSVEFFDIGLINVWNNSRNTWGTGVISKLFSDLSSEVMVMNPVFSKNSPHIIAFDNRIEKNGNVTFHTYSMNIATGEKNIVLNNNNMPSFPSFSMDDKRIAFSTYNYSGDKRYNIGYLDLNSNKISATGTKTIFVVGGRFPVYYGTGTRALGTKPVASFTSDTRQGGAPLSVQFVDMSEGNPTSWRWTFTGASPSSSTQQHPKVTYNSTGTYAVTLVATNSYGSGELVRQGYITVSTTGTELVLDETVTVYPNPASDFVWINGVSDQIAQVKLFDLTGKAFPATFAAEADKIRVDISRLPRGIYILHIALPDGALLTRKIVKQ